MNKPLESDWQTFRKRVPEWRERYLSGQNQQIAALFADGEKTPTEAFWAAEKKIKGVARILVDCLEVVGLRREGRTTYFENLARRRVAGQTRLALAELNTVEGGSPKQEYLVRIYAFAPDGTFLGETAEHSEVATFWLADGRRIVDETMMAGFSTDLSSEDIEAIGRNREHLLAIKVLIDSDMLDAAGQLLRRLEGRTAPGQKESLLGQLLAKRGECDAAQAAFTDARNRYPEICIPAEHYHGCPPE